MCGAAQEGLQSFGLWIGKGAWECTKGATFMRKYAQRVVWVRKVHWYAQIGVPQVVDGMHVDGGH